MLKEGLDVYLPLVDDDAIDAVIKRPDGRFVEIQIKARSKNAKFGDAALFAALTHEIRDNYWFVFYSERMNTIWILPPASLCQIRIKQAGANKDKRTLWFNGKNTKAQTEHVKPQYQKYIANDFRRILEEDPDA